MRRASVTELPVREPRDFEVEYDAGVTAMVFADTGTLAVTLGDGSLQLVGPDQSLRAVQAHDGAALCLALDIDGRSFVSGGDDGRLVRTNADGSMQELVRAPGRQIDVLAVSRPANARAVALGREVRLLTSSGESAYTSSHPSTVTGLAFNPKGKRLAVSHYGGVSLWWTASLGSTPQRLDWRGSHISVTWSPDGAFLMTAMQECELHGWRLKGNEPMAMRGYATKVRSMDWLAKPQWLVTAGADCVIAWPFAGAGPQGKAPAELCKDVGSLVTHVAVHPQQPLVAAGFEDGCVAICSVTSGSGDRIYRLRPPGGGRVTALAWSQDGARLATGSNMGMLSLFDLVYDGA
jgi:WD40 repeat protein